MSDQLPRRRFLALAAGGVGATLLATRWTDIVSVLSRTRGGDAAPPREFFTPAQAAEVEAMAEQIFPADDLPGARELRAVNFIDRALVTFAREEQHTYRAGLAMLQSRVAALYPGRPGFAALAHDEQLHLLRAIEATPFFELVRVHTILGCLTLPERGGNRDFGGWTVLGRDHRPAYQPPFGYYDRDDREGVS
jgi:gluconate 2-dehydrogenase gamma chain